MRTESTNARDVLAEMEIEFVLPQMTKEQRKKYIESLSEERRGELFRAVERLRRTK